jgi:hypothetical protein
MYYTHNKKLYLNDLKRKCLGKSGSAVAGRRAKKKKKETSKSAF